MPTAAPGYIPLCVCVTHGNVIFSHPQRSILPTPRVSPALLPLLSFPLAQGWALSWLQPPGKWRNKLLGSRLVPPSSEPGGVHLRGDQ